MGFQKREIFSIDRICVPVGFNIIGQTKWIYFHGMNFYFVKNIECDSVRKIINCREWIIKLKKIDA